MSRFSLFPKMRTLLLMSLIALPLNLYAEGDSDSSEESDDSADGVCAEVILESLGSIKDVMIKKYGDLCVEDAKSGKIKKNEKGKPIDSENCKKMKCFEDKSLKFKFKSSDSSDESPKSENSGLAGFEDLSKKGLFGSSADSESSDSAKNPNPDQKMTLSRCVDEGVDTSVPYLEMNSAQRQCNFLMNSTAGYMDKLRDSDVVTGYLGKSEHKQEQEDKDKLRYVYNNLTQCDSSIKSCGLTPKEAKRLYEKYSDSSDPQIKKWAASMRVLVPITLASEASSSAVESAQKTPEAYNSEYCKGVRGGRRLLATETMSAARCW